MRIQTVLSVAAIMIVSAPALAKHPKPPKQISDGNQVFVEIEFETE
jgi:hypothetical protein